MLNNIADFNKGNKHIYLTRYTEIYRSNKIEIYIGNIHR